MLHWTQNPRILKSRLSSFTNLCQSCSYILNLKNESTLSCALILSLTLFLTYAPSLSLSLLDQGVKCISCKRLVVIGWEWTGRVDENTNQLRQKMTDSSNKRRRMKPICNKIKNKKDFNEKVFDIILKRTQMGHNNMFIFSYNCFRRQNPTWFC